MLVSEVLRRTVDVVVKQRFDNLSEGDLQN